jgi:hypothetical protein
MNTFTPLFSGIVESSIWDEPYHVRVLWVTMLAIKDFDHVVRRNDYQLHKRANISLEECQDALRILSSPDERRQGQPFDGRRVEKVEDGWMVLNGQLYEDQMRDISRRFYKARKAREYRRTKKGGGTLDERVSVENGHMPGDARPKKAPKLFEKPVREFVED